MSDNKNTAPADVKAMQQRIAELEAQLAEKNNRSISFKVAEESGAISAYGVQNIRPVTLYRQQFERLIEAATGMPLAADSPLGKFITANGKYLAEKTDDDSAQKNKHTLRVAESHGVVAHPKNNGKTA